MITFVCPNCAKALKVKDELAGKRVKCPGCSQPSTVPTASANLAATTADAGKRSPTPVPSSEERTMPPKARPTPEAEGKTLPTNVAMGAHRTGDSSGSDTLGAGPNGGGHAPELTAFLAPPQAADEIGRLGPYRVLSILGHGGMGVVFRAHEPSLNRQVALKAMLPGLASGPSAKERFLREAQAAAAVKHPHIVTIHQVGEDRGAPFLAMEFLKGESLDDRVKREIRLPVPEILRIGREVAEGLEAAHEQGLIHRDIKPANIWLEGKKSLAKILDFGLARALADQTQLTQSGAIIGTPAYMAPEQAGGRGVDHRCDLFSLGCVLYRMCTGELPFKGTDTLTIISALALDTPKAPHDINAAVPVELSDLVLRLLAKKPEDRPQSAQEVVAELAELAEENTAEKTAGGATRLTRAGRTTKARTSGGKRRWLWPVVIAALVLLAAPLVWLASRERQRPEQSAVQPPGADAQPPGADASGSPEKLPAKFTNSLGMEFVLVPKGKFLMGGGGGIVGDKEVEIAHDFYLGTYEVMQVEWEKVTGANPSHYARSGAGRNEVAAISSDDLKRFPVETVSWSDAQAFLERLNAREQEAGWVYRLPKEVEWEYACRGGELANKLDYGFDYYFEKPTLNLLPDQANFAPEEGKGLQRTCKVGSYKPNRLGLYDMHGNVYEWCDDLEKSAEGAAKRVGRNGCWREVSASSRAATRWALAPSVRLDRFLGFRVARVPVGK